MNVLAHDNLHIFKNLDTPIAEGLGQHVMPSVVCVSLAGIPEV